MKILLPTLAWVSELCRYMSTEIDRSVAEVVSEVSSRDSAS